MLLWHWEPPFSVINFILNAVPVVISFKFIGKKFTGYSCLMIVVSGILTDMVPAWPVTEDILWTDQCTGHQPVSVRQCHQRRYGFYRDLPVGEIQH